MAATNGPILRAGITGFGTVPPFNREDVRQRLQFIHDPYTCTEITDPGPSNNYFTVTILNRADGSRFRMLVNCCYGQYPPQRRNYWTGRNERR